MKIDRELFDVIKMEIKEAEKIILLYGARQTGKTTLSNDILSKLPGKILMINADELKYHDILSSRDLRKLSLLVEGYNIVFIDEAQRIPDIGINLKIIHDQIPGIKLFVTGSSSLNLAGKDKEPLTGRTSSYMLYPISLSEIRKEMNAIELQSRIEEYMVFGMYPGIFNLKSYSQKEKYLREMTSSYLYKDVLELSYIKNSSKISNLLKLIALQIGSEVSVFELGKNLGLSHETVSSYIDLLEQSFIVFRLSGFSRNLRKEVSKRSKIYFWDLGIRNSLIDNHSLFNSRNDIGILWENFIIAERIKYLAYKQQYGSSYFWRTYTGAEIDYVEERQGELYAYEIKYGKEISKAPLSWIENYGSHFKCITKNNFWEFVT
jgi:predicted AAA+ superfamily ATPase